MLGAGIFGYLVSTLNLNIHAVRNLDTGSRRWCRSNFIRVGRRLGRPTSVSLMAGYVVNISEVIATTLTRDIEVSLKEDL